MQPGILSIADPIVGLILAAAGVVVLIHRRRHRVGILLTAASAAWFLGDLSPSLLFLHRGPMVHLHLSYPTGRLHRWPARVAVALAYVSAVADSWPPNSASVTAVVALTIALAAGETYARTSGPARKAGLPGLLAALLFVAVLALSAANQLLGWQSDTAVAIAYDTVVIIVPCWLAYDLLRGGWTEATVSELITQLGQVTPSTGPEAELRKALGDPSLRIGYPDGADGFIDSSDLPTSPGELQDVTLIEEGGQVIAAMFHAPGLRSDPALLDGANAALRLVVSNQRLRDDIAARAAALAAARRRLVETGDEQRALLSAELAAGPIYQLELAEQAVRASPDLDSSSGLCSHDLQGGFETALAELRRFAQDLLPWSLSDGGLRGALPANVLVDVDELPESVELAAYFVCTEALTNAAKHAQADTVTARVSRVADSVLIEVADDGAGGADPLGSGLQGLADRISALGGTFEISSALGQGTTINARIPLEGHVQ